jgi:glycosyltransferase involved in cell wall biosynthesis
LPDVAAPRVSVIVPTYRDWDRLALLIASLAAQDWPADRLEVIVVNNDPDEAPPATLQLPANARILTEASKGSYAARNAGLAEARGEIVLFTDSDCVADTGWVREAVAFLEGRPGRSGASAAGSMSRERHAGDRGRYEAAFAFPQEKYVAAGWAPTANMGTWAHVLEAVGPFDAAHYSGGDKEWGLGRRRRASGSATRDARP